MDRVERERERSKLWTGLREREREKYIVVSFILVALFPNLGQYL